MTIHPPGSTGGLVGAPSISCRSVTESPTRGVVAPVGHRPPRREQELGRVSLDADTFAAASLLLGACAQRAFAYDATREAVRPPVDEFAQRLARTLLAGIAD